MSYQLASFIFILSAGVGVFHRVVGVLFEIENLALAFIYNQFRDWVILGINDHYENVTF